MTLTPLFTAAELDAQITAYKKALTGLASMAEYTIDEAGIRQTVRKADLPEIRRTLEWLQEQRFGIEIGAGAQSIVGRPAR